MICRKCKKEVPDGAYCLLCGANQTPPAKAKRRRANGQGTIIKEDNGTYTAIKRKSVGGRMRTWKKRGFVKKSDAADYLARFETSKVKKAPTLNELYEGWSTSALLKLSRSKQYAYNLAWERLEPLHYAEISQLTISDLQSIVNTAVTHYPAKDIKTLLSRLYRRACAQGDVPTNLAEYIELPALHEKGVEPFTPNEVAQLWQDYAAGHVFTGYILLMIYTGMMPGELLTARKDQIDWGSKTIVGAGLKTKKRRETPLVLADTIIPVLERLCAESDGQRLAGMSKNRFYAQYYETLERAGCRKLVPYSCRHTTGTTLARTDTAPSIIQEVMRHTKFSTTQRYIHPDTGDTLDAVNKLH